MKLHLRDSTTILLMSTLWILLSNIGCQPVTKVSPTETSVISTPAVMIEFPTKTPQLGIIESGELFEVHPPSRVGVVNIWQGYVNGRLTLVYAGQLKPDYRASVRPQEIQQGAIYIMTLLPDGSIETSLHNTEEETGALRIEKYKENNLILISAGTAILASRVYYFNLQTLDFVSTIDGQSPGMTETSSPPTLSPYP